MPDTTSVFHLVPPRIQIREWQGQSLLDLPAPTAAVYVDVNEDGVFQANEPGIDGVVVALRDGFGNPVLDPHGEAIDVLTSDGGVYLFEDLEPGEYQIAEQQPTGVSDGDETIGSLGGTVVADDVMQVTLQRDDAYDYVFAELGGGLNSGESAGIGFWQNKHGQTLITKGGEALATWLTTNFGNVFGDQLLDASGQDVASFYRDHLFFERSKKSKGPAKVDTQFMATALNVYFTNRTLAGDVGSGYGFTVSDTGLGVRIVNVGIGGAAFGVQNDSNLSVLQLLQATNALTDTADNLHGWASIYDRDGNGIIDDEERRLRVFANSIFGQINRG